MNNYTDEDVRRAAERLTGKNFWRAEALCFADGPAGLRLQKGNGDSMGLHKAEPATSFPAHSALACTWNRATVYNVARRIGAEAAAGGVDILLAPAINIKRNPYNGRNFEYFSEDVRLTAELGKRFTDGVQSAGVGACVKHFAANNKETGRSVSDSVVPYRTLRETYLTAFEYVVKESAPAAVMTAYNRLNGVFCNENKVLLGDILRGEWGFKGIVVSDWGGVSDRIASLKAGADLEMPACPFSTDEIFAAYKSGELSAEDIFSAAARVEAASAVKRERKPYPADEHAQYAAEAAAECGVLLKNNGVLPLKKGERVGIFGKAAYNAPIQGGGSSHVIYNVRPRKFAEALAEEVCVVGCSGSYHFGGRAKRLAKKCDVAVVCLASYKGDSEGDDKSCLGLEREQTELVYALKEAGKKVVCLVVSGGPYLCGFDASADAHLYFGLSGQGFASAAAGIISGRINPSGRLAETFFEDPASLPSTREFFKDPYYTVYSECGAVGYRHCLASGEKPCYPFGYGLGYTEFSLSCAGADERGVSVRIENVGSRDGSEVVQIYASFPAAANEVSEKLVAFEKVFLKAGEARTIYIPFDGYAFRVYDVPSERWGTVGGKYTLYIARHSLDRSLSAVIDVAGDMPSAAPESAEGLAPAGYELRRDGRGRVIADLKTPFGELKNSRALLVRATVKAALYFTRGNPTLGGTLRYATVRMGANFGAFTTRRKVGIVQIFNGHYVSGLWKFMTRGKEGKKDKKATKKT